MPRGLFYFALLLLLVVQFGIASDPETVPIVSHIPRQHVESSALRSIGYSRRRHILEIEFVNGAIYRYYDITLSVYRDLMAAESKARYYDFNIRHKYLSARVKPRAKDEAQN
ncbi:MAG TPA: KTSC domain-containing protein [Chthoniobacterales bacterium]|nr:KTSC domain-containing protein [Chthoniobacterales bacterium]